MCLFILAVRMMSDRKRSSESSLIWSTHTDWRRLWQTSFAWICPKNSHLILLVSCKFPFRLYQHSLWSHFCHWSVRLFRTIRIARWRPHFADTCTCYLPTRLKLCLDRSMLSLQSWSNTTCLLSRPHLNVLIPTQIRSCLCKSLHKRRLGRILNLRWRCYP